MLIYLSGSASYLALPLPNVFQRRPSHPHHFSALIVSGPPFHDTRSARRCWQLATRECLRPLEFVPLLFQHSARTCATVTMVFLSFSCPTPETMNMARGYRRVGLVEVCAWAPWELPFWPHWRYRPARVSHPSVRFLLKGESWLLGKPLNSRDQE